MSYNENFVFVGFYIRSNSRFSFYEENRKGMDYCCVRAEVVEFVGNLLGKAEKWRGIFVFLIEKLGICG